jgi:hypothetical protein
MRIYLAGKMDATHGAWRDEIIGTRYVAGVQRNFPAWELARKITRDYDLDELEVQPWPKAPNTAVLGIHEYVGPYRWTFAPIEPMAKHLGYFHGSEGYGNHGYDMSDARGRRLIVSECEAAISRADLVFAYLNSPDCFGTLAEIGMAKAQGKFVYVAIEHTAEWEGTDYWFIEELADAYQSGRLDEDEGFGPDFKGDRIRGIFKDAIVAWTARALRPAPLALVKEDESERLLYALREAAQSFSQIGRWSSDPRVRDEAQRMLRRIAG